MRQPHPEKHFGGRRHFPLPSEILADHQDRTKEIADRCNYEMAFGHLQFPSFTPPDGSTPRAFLRRLVIEGLRQRYPVNASKMLLQVEEELGIILLK